MRSNHRPLSISQTPHVEVGARVRVEFAGEVRDYKIIEPSKGTYSTDYIPATSVLGQNLLGKHPGDEVIVDVPYHTFRFNVVSVESQPQR